MHDYTLVVLKNELRRLGQRMAEQMHAAEVSERMLKDDDISEDMRGETKCVLEQYQMNIDWCKERMEEITEDLKAYGIVVEKPRGDGE